MTTKPEPEGVISHAVEKVGEFGEELEGFVAERPLTALAISFVAGLVLARIVF